MTPCPRELSGLEACEETNTLVKGSYSSSYQHTLRTAGFDAKTVVAKQKCKSCCDKIFVLTKLQQRTHPTTGANAPLYRGLVLVSSAWANPAPTLHVVRQFRVTTHQLISFKPTLRGTVLCQTSGSDYTSCLV